MASTLGAIGLPTIIVAQAVVVLRAKEESKHGFSDEKCYEDRKE